MCDGFTPWTGNQGIPMIGVNQLDDEIQPDWSAPVLEANPAIIGIAAIRLLVIAAAAFGVVETYKQVRGDAAADVDDLISDIQIWLKRQTLERGFARQQKGPTGRKEAPFPIRDGESHEDKVLRALEELEVPPDLPDPGYNDTGPMGPPLPVKGERKYSFRGWLERKYDSRSVARYLRR